jgi:hypothetical protein
MRNSGEEIGAVAVLPIVVGELEGVTGKKDTTVAGAVDLCVLRLFCLHMQLGIAFASRAFEKMAGVIVGFELGVLPHGDGRRDSGLQAIAGRLEVVIRQGILCRPDFL